MGGGQFREVLHFITCVVGCEDGTEDGTDDGEVEGLVVGESVGARVSGSEQAVPIRLKAGESP